MGVKFICEHRASVYSDEVSSRITLECDEALILPQLLEEFRCFVLGCGYQQRSFEEAIKDLADEYRSVEDIEEDL